MKVTTNKGGRPKAPLTLSDDERQKLQTWASRPTSTQRLASRAKIVLACDSPAALDALADQAARDGLSVGLVRDAGRTVVSAGTATCVGVGPDEVGRIDAVTGMLRLLP